MNHLDVIEYCMEVGWGVDKNYNLEEKPIEFVPSWSSDLDKYLIDDASTFFILWTIGWRKHREDHYFSRNPLNKRLDAGIKMFLPIKNKGMFNAIHSYWRGKECGFDSGYSTLFDKIKRDNKENLSSFKSDRFSKIHIDGLFKHCRGIDFSAPGGRVTCDDAPLTDPKYNPYLLEVEEIKSCTYYGYCKCCGKVPFYGHKPYLPEHFEPSVNDHRYDCRCCRKSDGEPGKARKYNKDSVKYDIDLINNVLADVRKELDVLCTTEEGVNSSEYIIFKQFAAKIVDFKEGMGHE